MEEQTIPQSVFNPFDPPAFNLPSYEDFERNIPKIFNRGEDGGVTVRQPTLQDSLNSFAKKNTAIPDTQAIIDRYSFEESKGFKNEALPYDPNVNMADAYAKYDPVTWGDSFEKAWDTTVINGFNSIKNLWYGVKEGIGNGDVSAVYDNEYSRHLAEVTKNLEDMKPMYFTDEESNSTSAYLKQLFPALGYVASSVTEMAATHAALSIVGAAVGGASGGPAGAVGGVIGGNVAATVKDVTTIGNTLTKLYGAAKALNTLSTAQKITKGSQLIGTSLFFASGEAALNAQLSKQRLIEDAGRAYYRDNGRYLSGADLEKVTANADKAAAQVYTLNLPLIAASDFLQLGNLVRGKYYPRVADKMAFGIDKAGRAYTTNALKKVTGEYLKGSVAEGVEELGQKVIEDAAVTHFTNLKSTKDSYLDSYIDSVYKNVVKGEGASDFLGGALIGGITNIADFAGYKTLKDNSKKFVDDYNTTTSAYFTHVGDMHKAHRALGSAVKASDTEAIKDIYMESMVDMVNHHSRMGTTDTFKQTLSSLREMDTTEFANHFGLKVDDREKAEIINEIQINYERASQIRNDIDGVFQVNPYADETWFKRIVGKGSERAEIERGIKAWDVFKDTLTKTVVKADNVNSQVDESIKNISTLSGEAALIAGFGQEVAVSDYMDRLKSRIDAKLPGYEADERELERLNKASDAEKYKYITDKTGYGKLIRNHRLLAETAAMYQEKIDSLNTRNGQKKRLARIARLMDAMEAGVLPTTPSSSTVAPPATPSSPVTPPVALPTIPDVDANEETSLSLEDFSRDDTYSSSFGEGLTEATLPDNAGPLDIQTEQPNNTFSTENVVNAAEDSTDSEIEDKEVRFDEVMFFYLLNELEMGEASLTDRNLKLIHKGKSVLMVGKDERGLWVTKEGETLKEYITLDNIDFSYEGDVYEMPINFTKGTPEQERQLRELITKGFLLVNCPQITP